MKILFYVVNHRRNVTKQDLKGQKKGEAGGDGPLLLQASLPSDFFFFFLLEPSVAKRKAGVDGAKGSSSLPGMTAVWK